MASRKPRLNVSLSNKATRQLNEIYEYNLEKRGETIADRYIAFLRTKIASLAVDHGAGKAIESRPDLRYLLMIKRAGGDGHIAV